MEPSAFGRTASSCSSSNAALRPQLRCSVFRCAIFATCIPLAAMGDSGQPPHPEGGLSTTDRAATLEKGASRCILCIFSSPEKGDPT